MNDNWRVIPSHPAYEVSRHGAVRRRNGHLRKVTPNPRSGYLTIGLWESNREKRRYVHHLVAEAFIGPRPDGLEVAHNDGDKTNNRAENLRYATRLENEADKELHGTRLRGERTPGAKLTQAAVDDIHGYMSYDFTQREIAEWYGVSPMTISLIRHGKVWADGRKAAAALYGSGSM